jgi:hypothetical protein
MVDGPLDFPLDQGEQQVDEVLREWSSLKG